MADYNKKVIAQYTFKERVFQPSFYNNEESKKDWHRDATTNKKKLPNLNHLPSWLAPYYSRGVPKAYPICKPLAEEDSIKKIVAGLNFVIILGQSGKLYSYGRDQCGELGLGYTYGFVDKFIPIDLPDKIIDVVSGDRHVLALAQNGTLYAWGNSICIGSNKRSNVHKPDAINNLLNKEPVIGIGARDTRSLILTLNGLLYTSGKWSGDARMADYQFVAIFNNPGSMKNKATIEMTDNGAYIITDCSYQDQNVSWIYSVGSVPKVLVGVTCYEDYPQPTFSSPQLLVCSPILPINTLISKVINRDTTEVASIKTGSSHVLMLLNNGELYVWGDNTWGQCGVGPQQTIVNKPTLLKFPYPVQYIAAGEDSSACVCNNSLYVWGCNRYNKFPTSVLDFVSHDKAVSKANIQLEQEKRIYVRGLEDSYYRPHKSPVMSCFSSSNLFINKDFLIVTVQKVEFE